MNSSVTSNLLQILSPTLNYSAGPIGSVPAPTVDDQGNTSQKLESVVNHCIEIAKTDWDSQETSWDFRRSPLV